MEHLKDCRFVHFIAVLRKLIVHGFRDLNQLELPVIFINQVFQKIEQFLKASEYGFSQNSFCYMPERSTEVIHSN